MKLTIERDVYLAALTKVSGTVQAKNTLPILGHIYHKAEGNTLTLRATDLDLEVTTKVECDVEQEGECTLPADLLNGIVKKYKKGPIVTLDATGNRATISQGRSRFNLSMLSAEDYPKLASEDYDASFTMAADDLDRIIGKTLFAMSTEETRYYLNGIYMHSTDDGITCVSTDGHRLGKSWCDQKEHFHGVIIPRKTVSEIRKVLDIGNVDVSVSETKIKIDIGDTVIVSKVIDAAYVDYNRVIPQGLKDNFRIDATEFSTAASAVALVCEDKRARGVKVGIGSGEVSLSVSGQDNDAENVVE